MDTINLNIALKPSKNSEGQLLELSNSLGQNNDTNLIFRVDSKNFFFHLTLYQTIFPMSAVDDIMKMINRYSKEFEIFKFYALSLVEVEKAIWLNLADTKELKTAHNLTLNRFSDLRDGLIPEKYAIEGERFNAFSGSKREMVEKYGNPYVSKERSMPHLTFCEFRESTPDLLIKQVMNRTTFDFEEIVFDKVALFETGDNGTCVKILHEVKLTNN